jgi:hypothetical protein
MTLGLIQQNERGAKFHPALQDLTHHLALWRCRWLSFALSSNCWRTLWAVGAHTMTRARDVHATWLAVAPPAAKSRQTQVEYYQPVAAALVTGRKVCPAVVLLDTVSAYYMFGCAVCALLRQLHTVFGIQFHSQD